MGQKRGGLGKKDRQGTQGGILYFVGGVVPSFAVVWQLLKPLPECVNNIETKWLKKLSSNS